MKHWTATPKLFSFLVQFFYMRKARGSEVYDLRHIFMLNFWRFLRSAINTNQRSTEISWHSLTPLLSSREHNFTIIKIKQIVGFKLFKALFKWKTKSSDFCQFSMIVEPIWGQWRLKGYLKVMRPFCLFFKHCGKLCCRFSNWVEGPDFCLTFCSIMQETNCRCHLHPLLTTRVGVI